MSEATLDPDRIHSTLELLQLRIDERFPGAGLGQLCRRLLGLSASARATIEQIQRPILALRAVIAALVGLILAGLGVTLVQVVRPEESLTLGEFIQVLEAGINDVVLASVNEVEALTTGLSRKIWQKLVILEREPRT